MNQVHCDIWHHALDQWHESLLEKKQKTRANISKDTKLFLKFLYSNIVTVHDDKQKGFDLEHLYTIEILSDLVQRENYIEGLPISAPGNLAILPKGLNRAKKGQMLGEHLMSNLNSRPTTDELNKISTYVIHPAIEDLIPDDVNAQVYEDFLRERFQHLKNKVLSNLQVQFKNPN